jgi:hypothetical protein
LLIYFLIYQKQCTSFPHSIIKLYSMYYILGLLSFLFCIEETLCLISRVPFWRASFCSEFKILQRGRGLCPGLIHVCSVLKFELQILFFVVYHQRERYYYWVFFKKWSEELDSLMLLYTSWQNELIYVLHYTVENASLYERDRAFSGGCAVIIRTPGLTC